MRCYFNHGGVLVVPLYCGSCEPNHVTEPLYIGDTISMCEVSKCPETDNTLQLGYITSGHGGRGPGQGTDVDRHPAPCALAFMAWARACPCPAVRLDR
eukprot:COSAG01_NODE_1081_length_11817_cov_3.279911_9_plen_98_part_00